MSLLKTQHERLRDLSSLGRKLGEGNKSKFHNATLLLELQHVALPPTSLKGGMDVERRSYKGPINMCSELAGQHHLQLPRLCRTYNEGKFIIDG